MKALILDFDYTLYNTDVDNAVRKNIKGSQIVWDNVFAKIPEYHLYAGWREVFDWCGKNNIKIGIISTAKKILIEKTLEHFNLHVNVVIGWQLYYQKPNPKLVEMALRKLNVDPKDVISIGDSIVDKTMSDNGGIRFVGAIWDSKEANELNKGEVIESPLNIVDLFQME